MKKIIPLSIASLIILSGCIWPILPDTPALAVPADQPTGVQPKYHFENYNPYVESAVERSVANKNVADFNQNSSYKMQEALAKSIVSVKKQYPAIFKEHNSFLVGALVKVDDIDKSEKAGRITGMGLSYVIGKTAHAEYVRYKRNMITVQNQMVAPTAAASKAAEIFKADAIVMGVYKVTDTDIMIRYAFYDAKSRAYLGEGTAEIPLDRQTSKFALDL